MKADIILKILYDINFPEKIVIKTNAKPQAVKGILGVWLSCQIGLGEDSREANVKDVYTIDIWLDLSDDTFSVDSDTGNDGLTCGLILDVFTNIDEIKILSLS